MLQRHIQFWMPINSWISTAVDEILPERPSSFANQQYTIFDGAFGLQRSVNNYNFLGITPNTYK